MNISYDYYKIFYYVAKYGSFTQAATMLLSNQPNVTRAIKALEAELGCTLFERTNKGARLTPEGNALYDHISLAFEHIQAGEEEISQNKSLQKGMISIGATEIALRCFLLPLLNEFRQRYPNIKIKISNLSTPQALSALKNGLVDCAIVTAPTEHSDSLSIKVLKAFSEVAVCGELYKSAFENKAIHFSELVNYPIISFKKSSSTFGFYSALFMQHGVIFSPDIEAATADQILPLVKHNLGIGFVPEDFLNDEPSGIFKIQLKEQIPARSICIATLKGSSLSLPAKELKRMIDEFLPK